METHQSLTTSQKVILGAAFVPMLATGVAGGIGTYSNISRAYGQGTALGAVAAGEGATAVLALVLLGLTMLGQSSPRVIRVGLWALPAAASAMSAMAADDPGRAVIYAITPMGMCVAAEGMAFLARRIVVHTDGRDAEAEARAAAVVRSLAYQRAVAANHPDEKVREKADRRSWKLARTVGSGDHSLGLRLLEVQRERVTHSADSALGAMFTTPDRSADQTADPEGANQIESAGSVSHRSGAELRESADPATTAAPARSALAPVAAAESARTRRATGRVPQSARTKRPARTPAQLLVEARAATADWPDAKLTADHLRVAVHTSASKARELREILRAEREGRAAEQRHQVEAPGIEDAFARLAPGRPHNHRVLEVAA